ncbi:hypothetical protein HUJ05_002169 [Dendroctonus ponderosae]|nr:hypothetical protein HUJ05_002169 [Dendroctonus ponderosae]
MDATESIQTTYLDGLSFPEEFIEREPVKPLIVTEEDVILHAWIKLLPRRIYTWRSPQDNEQKVVRNEINNFEELKETIKAGDEGMEDAWQTIRNKIDGVQREEIRSEGSKKLKSWMMEDILEPWVPAFWHTQTVHFVISTPTIPGTTTIGTPYAVPWTSSLQIRRERYLNLIKFTTFPYASALIVITKVRLNAAEAMPRTSLRDISSVLIASSFALCPHT